ncbi:50S ribosomal protein L19 [Candidatus Roizmanbacteria bacterium]|nr:50S ribosomal protein L19 [Candidatus Roizmanbacteria bacterium]
MSNSILYKDQLLAVGDMIDITYLFKEDEKEREQVFEGILIKVNGDTPENRMITVRKISRSGVGIERIIPLASPYIKSLKLVKKSNNAKAKIYFIRGLSDQQLRTKLYQAKKPVVKAAPKKRRKVNVSSK